VSGGRPQAGATIPPPARRVRPNTTVSYRVAYPPERRLTKRPTRCLPSNASTVVIDGFLLPKTKLKTIGSESKAFSGSHHAIDQM
jgi:hypothetical protein